MRPWVPRGSALVIAGVAACASYEHQRHFALEGRLDTANADLTDSAQLVNARLALLEQPEQLYRRCNDQQRSLLNQAIFHAVYIEDEKITGGDLREPFAELHAIQRQRATATNPEPINDKATRNAGGHARRQALRSYSVAFIQALVLVRPLGWTLLSAIRTTNRRWSNLTATTPDQKKLGP